MFAHPSDVLLHLIAFSITLPQKLGWEVEFVTSHCPPRSLSRGVLVCMLEFPSSQSWTISHPNFSLALALREGVQSAPITPRIPGAVYATGTAFCTSGQP